MRTMRIPGAGELRDVAGDGDGSWWVVGADGEIWYTPDRGASWERRDSKVKHQLWQVVWRDGQLWLVGSTDRSSVLLHSRDGVGFRKLKIGRRSWLRGVASNGPELWVSGDRELLRSTDGGKGFDVVREGYFSTRDLLCDGDRVYTIGYDDIRCSVDGETFAKQHHDVGAHLAAMDGTVEHGLFAVGSWDLLHSTDGGASWNRPLADDRSLILHGVAVASASEVWVVGDGGKVLRSQDAGQTWAKVAVKTRERLLGVRCIGTDLVIVGAGGFVGVHELPTAPPRPADCTRSARPPTPPDDKDAAVIRERIGDRQRHVFLDMKGLRSIEGLRAFPDIEDLTLYGPVKDLGPVAALQKLSSISLRGAVPDLTPLRACPALRTVDLSDASRADLAPLSGLPLESLSLPARTTNLFVIGELPQLTSLSAGKGWEQLANVTGTFTTLSIQTKKIGDLSPIAHLTQLQRLHLGARGCDVADLSPLTALTGLTGLWCAGAKLTDLRPLADLPLTHLDVESNKGLTSLEGVPQTLTSLSANLTKVKDLEPLWGLGLTELKLRGTSISSLEPVLGAPLRVLFAEKSKLRSLDGIGGVATLEFLWFWGSKVRDLSPLAGMTGLRDLNAADLGQVTGAEALSTLTSLRSLDVIDTAIDPQLLRGLPLDKVRGVPWPLPGTVLSGPPPQVSDALGDGLVLDGRFGAVTFPDAVEDIDLSADGSRLVAATRSVARVVQTSDGEVLAEWPGEFTGAALSPDGERVWLCSVDERLWEAELGGQLQERAKDRVLWNAKLALSPDGRTIAVQSDRIALWCDGGWAEVIPCDADREARACFDGERLLVYGRRPGVVSLCERDGTEVAAWDAPYKTGLGVTASERFVCAVADNGYGIAVHDRQSGARVLPERLVDASHIGSAVVVEDLIVHACFQFDGLRSDGRRQEGPPIGMSRPTPSAFATSASMLAYAFFNYREGDFRVFWLPLHRR